MSESAEWPALLGSQRKQYLARCFGSVDGSVAGVANPFDRRRLKARYRYEEQYAALWQADALRFCETAADKEAAILAAHHSQAETEAWHRKALKRPASLHSGLMKSFTKPFNPEYDTMYLDDYCESGSRHEGPVSAMRARVPESRIKYLCFRAWSSDETPENVPEEWKPWFDEQMAYQREAHDESLEVVCRHYGSKTGRPADIPKSNHAAAATYWRRWQARHEMRAAFEYELYVTDAEEQMEREAEDAAERKAEEVIEGIERQIEEAAQDILQDILDEQRATS
ncbi:hypothetical protein [Bradyrhizobium diazoefficiens]|uniref:hypothetical protein n=1 Tax=Bradyrhizobium diazoefficiens TaxID=1355477 RepID=UPI00272A7E81|nr:hypothetical protein [Bradyrhizobium diazoefficiens]WLA65671.1 hypothetical protein QNN01_01885 [Bradyrhizobium diazoefficiens]